MPNLSLAASAAAILAVSAGTYYFTVARPEASRVTVSSPVAITPSASSRAATPSGDPQGGIEPVEPQQSDPNGVGRSVVLDPTHSDPARVIVAYGIQGTKAPSPEPGSLAETMELGLGWLAKHQSSDGSWDLQDEHPLAEDPSSLELSLIHI